MSEPEKKDVSAAAPGMGPAPVAPAGPPAGAPGSGLVDVELFRQVELRAGRVVAARAHEKADKLLVLQVDIGESEPRQIVAGIRADWAPEQLVGRTIIVVANLKPAVLRGVESRGMLLAVRGTEKVVPLGVDGEVAPGTRVT